MCYNITLPVRADPLSNKSIKKQQAVGAGGLGFDSRAGQIGHGVATAAMFLRCCVVKPLSRGDAPRNSSHASA